MEQQKLTELLSEMTLDEKISCCNWQRLFIQIKQKRKQVRWAT